MKWLRAYVASPLSPTLIAPLGGTGLPLNPIMTWSSSATAKSYHLQISTNTGFSTVAMDTMVADTVVRARQLSASTRQYWRVAAVNDSGAGAWSATGAFQTGTIVDAIEEEPPVARSTALLQNYPNPFNPSTMIPLTLAGRGYAVVTVYDVLGREVATLMNEVKDPGTYLVEFDASHLAGGVYYCRMQVRPAESAPGRDARDGTGTMFFTQKMILLR